MYLGRFVDLSGPAEASNGCWQVPGRTEGAQGLLADFKPSFELSGMKLDHGWGIVLAQVYCVCRSPCRDACLRFELPYTCLIVGHTIRVPVEPFHHGSLNRNRRDV